MDFVKHNNFENNKTLENKIKAGVDFVFEQNPELTQIGTKQQYSEYSDTIFADSKIKDIVYHTSSNKIEKFRDSMFGAYFSYSPIQGAYGDVINSVLLNVKSLLMKPKPKDSTEEKVIYDKEYRSYNNPSFSSEGDRIYKYDASIENSTVTKEGIQIKVRNPEQIHILGSKEDIAKFKEFVSSKEDQIR